MKFWPLSQVASSPILYRACAFELERVYVTKYISNLTYEACAAVLPHLPPTEAPLVVIESDGAAMALAYAERPDPDAFARLERANFLKNNFGFSGFMVDRLH